MFVPADFRGKEWNATRMARREEEVLGLILGEVWVELQLIFYDFILAVVFRVELKLSNTTSEHFICQCRAHSTKCAAYMSRSSLSISLSGLPNCMRSYAHTHAHTFIDITNGKPISTHH